MERKALAEIPVRPEEVELVDDEEEEPSSQPQVGGPPQERPFLGVLGRDHHDCCLTRAPLCPFGAGDAELGATPRKVDPERREGDEDDGDLAGRFLGGDEEYR